jgi:hypothetical protein
MILARGLCILFFLGEGGISFFCKTTRSSDKRDSEPVAQMFRLPPAYHRRQHTSSTHMWSRVGNNDKKNHPGEGCEKAAECGWPQSEYWWKFDRVTSTRSIQQEWRLWRSSSAPGACNYAIHAKFFCFGPFHHSTAARYTRLVHTCHSRCLAPRVSWICNHTIQVNFLTSLVSITLVSICFWLTSKKLQTGCAKAVVRQAVCLQKKAFKWENIAEFFTTFQLALCMS